MYLPFLSTLKKLAFVWASFFYPLLSNLAFMYNTNTVACRKCTWKLNPSDFFCNSSYICTCTLCNHALPFSFPHPTNFFPILFSPLLSHLQRHTLLSLPPSRAFVVVCSVASLHHSRTRFSFCLFLHHLIYLSGMSPLYQKKKLVRQIGSAGASGGTGGAYNNSSKKKEGRAQIRRLCGTLLQQSFVYLMGFENKIGGGAQTWV